MTPPTGDASLDLIPRLRRYARGLVASREAADALVHATLERAGPQARLAADDRALRIRLFSLMHEIYMEGSGSAETSPGGRGMAEFDRALAGLPRLQREVFLLVTLEELSYEEVARTLAIPIGTVMSRLSRAREKLRARLRPHA